MIGLVKRAVQRLRAGRDRRLQRGLERRGYVVTRGGEAHPIPADFSDEDRDLIASVRPYTLTTPERITALRDAVRHVVTAGVDGDFVECGVWRGGSAMVIAATLAELGAGEREIHLFDTFEDMPAPDERDHHLGGWACADRFDPEYARTSPIFSYLPFDEVRQLVIGAGHPAQRIHFVKGLVEETIPARAPDRIALCRLDTDWYRSTAHELEHLIPRMSPGGIVIIDDYGEFLGARRAVDEYLAADGRPFLLHRVDVSCRILVIPPDPGADAGQ